MVHDDARAALEYEPPGHGVHVLAPAPAKLPAAQASHVEDEVAPGHLLAVPEGQLVQELAPEYAA